MKSSPSHQKYMKADDVDGNEKLLKCIYCTQEKYKSDFQIQIGKKVKTTKLCSECGYYHRGRLKQIREIILIRDRYLCVYCHDYAETIDHVIPVSKGGDTSLENCVSSCEPCNTKKGDSLIL